MMMCCGRGLLTAFTPRHLSSTCHVVPQPKKPKMTCPSCYEDVNKQATRCKFCTADISRVPPAKELPV